MLHLEPPVRAANGDATLERLAFCIAASTTCAQTCIACTDAALSGPDVLALRSCARSAQDCADICSLTAKLLMRGSGRNHAVIRAQIDACVVACRACRSECERHVTVLEFCGVCTTACRICENACSELAPAFRS